MAFSRVTMGFRALEIVPRCYRILDEKFIPPARLCFLLRLD